MKLTLDEIYADKLHVACLTKSDDIDMEELFLNKLYSQLQALKFKNLNVYATTTSYQGFFSKKIELLIVEFKKSRVKNLHAAFMVENSGGIYSFRMYKNIDSAYAKKVIEKPVAQRSDLLKNMFSSFEARHDFSMFDMLMDQHFDKALKSIL